MEFRDTALLKCSRELLEDFLKKWFGSIGGREVGTPHREFVEDCTKWIEKMEFCRRRRLPCYISVQPYSARDRPCAIERLFFEFDGKGGLEMAWRDALTIADALRRFYGAEPLLLFSGNRSYHVYAFLKTPIIIEPSYLELAKKAYKELQLRILEGPTLPTLDRSVIGDIKRLARSPLSTHEETGKLCTPVTLEGKPFIPEDLDAYKALDPDFFSPIFKELRAREVLMKALSEQAPRRARAFKSKRGIRPCIWAALDKQLDGGNGHLMRLAIVREFLATGYSVEEIIPLFQRQADFNLEKTRYYVEHAAKNPVRPFRCKTIKELGFCLPNCKKLKRR